jgi:hypothetical protein
MRQESMDFHNSLHAMELAICKDVMVKCATDKVETWDALRQIRGVQSEVRSTHARIERMYRNVDKIIKPAE